MEEHDPICGKSSDVAALAYQVILAYVVVDVGVVLVVVYATISLQLHTTRVGHVGDVPLSFVDTVT